MRYGWSDFGYRNIKPRRRLFVPDGVDGKVQRDIALDVGHLYPVEFHDHGQGDRCTSQCFMMAPTEGRSNGVRGSEVDS